MGLHDECGVVGIFCPKADQPQPQNAARLAYFALTSLQHRGQESAGIAVSRGEKITLHKGMGLISDVFCPEHFERLKGNLAVGHVRYATAGGRTLENAQPFMNTYKLGSIALSHNGQLVNYNELREILEDYGCTFSSTSDSEVILKLIVRKFIENGGKPGSRSQPDFFDGKENLLLFENAVTEACRLIKGSFALCIMTENLLIGARDPNGIRPLCLGAFYEQGGGESLAGNSAHSCSSRIPPATPPGDVSPQHPKASSYILASESCAIDAVNAFFLRDIAPGEIVIINKDGIKSTLLYSTASATSAISMPAEFATPVSRPASSSTKGTSSIPAAADSVISVQDEGTFPRKQTCIFEYVYFARPDSVIDGIPVQEARSRMGEQLAAEAPVPADVVIGVPDSGIGAALGYAKASGIPYVTGIIKNKYIGRTFIAPTQSEREAMVYVKLNAIKSELDNKRVIVIDDSIVRGTTSRRLVQILRRAGAREVHFRVSSPPVKFPCHLGIDTPSKAELISSTHELEEIRREIGADSLAFISLKGMLKALGSDRFCQGCFNGVYPV